MTDSIIANAQDAVPTCEALIYAEHRVAELTVKSVSGLMLVYLLADAYLDGKAVILHRLSQADRTQNDH